MFRLIDTQIQGNWIINGGDNILEGTTVYSGYIHPGSVIYDFRNTSVEAVILPTGEAALSKTGTGASAGDADYKIYYSFDEDDFASGTVSEYTGPIPINGNVMLYAAIGCTKGTGTYYSTPFKINLVSLERLFDCVEKYLLEIDLDSSEQAMISYLVDLYGKVDICILLELQKDIRQP